MEKVSQKFTEILSTNETNALVYNVSESIDELYQQLNFVDVEEFSKLVSDKRKREYLGVRVALKQLLGIEKQIVYNEEGKPTLFDGSYHISVSHSANWIAVIAHPTRTVGIDIEVPTEKMKKLFKRFLNETEQKELSNCENLTQLMLAWSGKEALYKIIGIEAVDFANQLHIFPFEIKGEGIFTAKHIPTKREFQLQYTQNEAYVLVYCIV
jgi:phosphopantetheinyl transferase